MIDPRLKKYPGYQALWERIPARENRSDRKHLEIPGYPCPLCGEKDAWFVHDRDFFTYFCAHCYYSIYWNPDVLRKGLPLRTGIDRELLYRFITHLGEKKRSRKLDHLVILEIK